MKRFTPTCVGKTLDFNKKTGGVKAYGIVAVDESPFGASFLGFGSLFFFSRLNFVIR